MQNISKLRVRLYLDNRHGWKGKIKLGKPSNIYKQNFTRHTKTAVRDIFKHPSSPTTRPELFVSRNKAQWYSGQACTGGNVYRFWPQGLGFNPL